MTVRGRVAVKSSMTAAAMYQGRVVRKVPRGALPTAVRTASTITASFIQTSFLSSYVTQTVSLRRIVTTQVGGISAFRKLTVCVT